MIWLPQVIFWNFLDVLFVTIKSQKTTNNNNLVSRFWYRSSLSPGLAGPQHWWGCGVEGLLVQRSPTTQGTASGFCLERLETHGNYGGLNWTISGGETSTLLEGIILKTCCHVLPMILLPCLGDRSSLLTPPEAPCPFDSFFQVEAMYLNVRVSRPENRVFVPRFESEL